MCVWQQWSWQATSLLGLPHCRRRVQNITDNVPPAWCSRPATRPPLLRQHLWLMQTPPGPRRMCQGVWKVVCLAALNAMDVGRRAALDYFYEVFTSVMDSCTTTWCPLVRRNCTNACNLCQVCLLLPPGAGLYSFNIVYSFNGTELEAWL